MPNRQISAALLVGASLVAPLLAPAAHAQSRGGRPQPAPAGLQRIAEFPHQVTGVAVAPDGRIFVNFPRWTEDSPISVAEVKDGRMTPFPDARWNEWRNARKDELNAGDRFVCVQNVVVDSQGRLWVLDSGAPAHGDVVPGVPKLVRIDLASNRAAKTIAFGPEVAMHGSYLNDVRFTPDGRIALITDSGAKGAIVVVDLESGENGVADGLLIGRRDGRMFITAPEEDAVKLRPLDTAGAAPSVLIKDLRLRRPDSLAEGPDGMIYVTISRIQDSALFKPGAAKSLTTQLWRSDPRAAERTGSTGRR
jgi:sugar lactone lactonase YvrE